MKWELIGFWLGKLVCEEIYERVIEGCGRDRNVGSREELVRRR